MVCYLREFILLIWFLVVIWWLLFYVTSPTFTHLYWLWRVRNIQNTHLCFFVHVTIVHSWLFRGKKAFELFIICVCLPASVSAGALRSHRAPSGARVSHLSIEHSPSAREVKRSYPLSHPPSPRAFELFQTLYVAAGINCRLFLTYSAAHALSLSFSDSPFLFDDIELCS